ncbi:DUF427 domain-containing protein [Mycobacterium xenopi]|uniref:DUF427 domain-containing protein n=1 Tax=Mycobacterium xenopi TaxID=1789 RepID=A0AAD1H4D9_MYCXE|nr:DUF427 domain-containing protein [Mycobacterium xenopi]MDA3641099.1 DUF427 domain-containing protein [Mycobacterium xenopi]MDA3656553.1 DUF427 domain-containing protein [Mycobacterium xenopi]MDA3662944.1 DUF427 domain-containing protein [Mycobacterium xenopi]ORX20860.1 hypothetical protein AWC32_03250 [Mycobacterium xenopi]SPX89731.1 short-chain dehydrogenase of uncharacterised substrate specificity [Mycobacterium xenopi]
MATKMSDLLGGVLASLRYEPTEKRLRVCLDDELVADTRRGLLVWEPRRVVPTYAVPVSDLSARLEHVETAAHPGDQPLLDPAVASAAHSCPGAVFDVVVDDLRRAAAAFRPDDPDLADYVVLDFGAFEWREEDEPIVAHPHDPFKRIDIVASTRHVRLELQGRLLAASSRPMLLFETLLPVRFYLPPADVAVELEPSDTVTYCAYKGRASYFSVPGGPADLAWTYHHPLHDAEPVRDRIAFFDERVDVIVDGERRQRPVTPWSR